MSLYALAISRNGILYDFMNEERNFTVKNMGSISDKDVKLIIEVAKKLKLRLFSLIHEHDLMVFNKKQIEQSKKELQALNGEYPDVYAKLKPFTKAIELADQQFDLYVTFKI